MNYQSFEGCRNLGLRINISRVHILQQTGHIGEDQYKLNMRKKV